MKAEKAWALIRFSITAVVLFGIWLLFTTSLDPISLITGGVGSLLIALLTYDVFIARHQAHLGYIIPNPVYLLIYLLLAMALLYISSFKMLAAVITGNVQPRIVHFRTRLRSDMARMILASTITLTPGTVTLDLNDDHLTVHWFFCTTSHGKAAGEAVKGRLERVLQRVLR